MGQLSRKLRSTIWRGRRGIAHWCPGCRQMHSIPTEGESPVWKFDGNLGAPTTSPSIHIFVPAQPEETDAGGVYWPAEPQRTICHYFLEAGAIKFCADSAHALKGQTVPLPDLPRFHRDAAPWALLGPAPMLLS